MIGSLRQPQRQKRNTGKGNDSEKMKKIFKDTTLLTGTF